MTDDFEFESEKNKTNEQPKKNINGINKDEDNKMQPDTASNTGQANRMKQSTQAFQDSVSFSGPQDDEAYFNALYAAHMEMNGKKSFRKRHPKTFWLLSAIVVIFLLNILGAVWHQLDYRGVFSGPRLGVVRIEGIILDSESIVKWIEELEKNPSVHGVLIRVNSPGGAVVPSQEIYSAIKRLAAKKTVVTSMGSAGASGGYYVAVASEYIVANPSTVTGSIGVKMEFPELQALLQNIGIKSQSLSTGALKDAGSPYRPMTAEERVYLEALIEDMYESFVQAVAQGRNMSIDKIKSMADGRAFTGMQAQKLGLIDAIGDKDFAMRELAKRSNIKDLPSDILEGPEERKSVVEQLFSLFLKINVADKVKGEAGYRFYY